MVINLGFGDQNADVGVFDSVGATGGANVSTDAFVGYDVRGTLTLRDLLNCLQVSRDPTRARSGHEHE